LVFEKVAERLTGRMKEQYTNADMERGNELEEMARNSYELETGNKVEQVGFVELSEHVGGSPDGVVGEGGLMEIKCPSDPVFARFLYTRKIDPGYYAQMQMQMYVTGRKWCDYVLFNENFPTTTVVTRVERDEKKIEKLKVGLESAVTQLQTILDKIYDPKK
jgi:predicted phage-related endonuclease